MKYSRQIRSISYLKAHAAEVVRDLAERQEPLVITQNGEAKAVLQDVASYEETQERLAFLKILALGNRQIEEGRTVPAAEAVQALRACPHPMPVPNAHTRLPGQARATGGRGRLRGCPPRRRATH